MFEERVYAIWVAEFADETVAPQLAIVISLHLEPRARDVDLSVILDIERFCDRLDAACWIG